MTIEWTPDLSLWSATRAETQCAGPVLSIQAATEQAETLGGAKKAAEAVLTTTPLEGRR